MEKYFAFADQRTGVNPFLAAARSRTVPHVMAALPVQLVQGLLALVACSLLFLVHIIFVPVLPSYVSGYLTYAPSRLLLAAMGVSSVRAVRDGNARTREENGGSATVVERTTASPFGTFTLVYVMNLQSWADALALHCATGCNRFLVPGEEEMSLFQFYFWACSNGQCTTPRYRVPRAKEWLASMEPRTGGSICVFPERAFGNGSGVMHFSLPALPGDALLVGCSWNAGGVRGGAQAGGTAPSNLSSTSRAVAVSGFSRGVPRFGDLGASRSVTLAYSASIDPPSTARAGGGEEPGQLERVRSTVARLAKSVAVDVDGVTGGIKFAEFVKQQGKNRK